MCRSVIFFVVVVVCFFLLIKRNYFPASFYSICLIQSYQKPQAQLALASNQAFGWSTLVLAKLCRLSWQRVTLWHFQSGAFITSNPPRYVCLWHFGRGGADTGYKTQLSPPEASLYVFVNEHNLLYICILMCMHVCRSMLWCVCYHQELISHSGCCISRCAFSFQVFNQKKKNKFQTRSGTM